VRECVAAIVFASVVYAAAALLPLMAQHAGDAALLTAFDQHLPAGQKMLLPIP